jgi:hypothetical protein
MMLDHINSILWNALAQGLSQTTRISRLSNFSPERRLDGTPQTWWHGRIVDFLSALRVPLSFEKARSANFTIEVHSSLLIVLIGHFTPDDRKAITSSSDSPHSLRINSIDRFGKPAKFFSRVRRSS